MISKFRFLAGVVAVVLTTQAALAGAMADRVLNALRIDDVVAILSQEGRDLAQDYDEMDLGVPIRAWEAELNDLYEVEALKGQLRAELIRALDGTDKETVAAFFESTDGAAIIEREINARLRMSDEAAKAAAYAIWQDQDEDTPLKQNILRFVNANDLIERNIVGAMNSDLAYFRGMSQGGAFNEEDILMDLWANEAEVRGNVEEWIFGYAMLAYGDLPAEKMESYISFSESEAGRALNAALFDAFDVVFERQSFALGVMTSALLERFSAQAL